MFDRFRHGRGAGATGTYGDGSQPSADAGQAPAEFSLASGFTTMPAFVLQLRGYDRVQVDQLVALAEQAIAADDPRLRAHVAQALRATKMQTVLRGYSIPQVDDYRARSAAELDGG